MVVPDGRPSLRSAPMCGQRFLQAYSLPSILKTATLRMPIQIDREPPSGTSATRPAGLKTLGFALGSSAPGGGGQENDSFAIAAGYRVATY